MVELHLHTRRGEGSTEEQQISQALLFGKEHHLWPSLQQLSVLLQALGATLEQSSPHSTGTQSEQLISSFKGNMLGMISIFLNLLRQEVNIRKYDNSIPISESSMKLWNQEYFTLTFPEPHQPGQKKTRSSELQIAVPRSAERKLEEVQKPAHIWIQSSLRKIFQRPSIYLTVRRQAPFRHPYTPKTHLKKTEYKNSKDDQKKTTFKKDSKKNIGPYKTTPESKKTVYDKKPKRQNKEYKSPSKSSHENELSMKSKYKSETNSESKDSKVFLMKHPKKNKRDSKDSKEIDIDSICTKKDSKSSKNNSDVKSQTCSKNTSNVDVMMYLEESGAESMEFGMWLKNCSQNNSKKASKKEANKSSDAESLDSKDAKKDKKTTKKDSRKKDSKKDTESTDEGSVDSKDAKKDSRKAKKESKKNDKKKDAKKDAESTDAESVDSKDAKKDLKRGKKDSKKNDKKRDIKKDAESTDAESESELESKKGKKDSKKDKKGSQKDDKKKDAKKDAMSTDADSESEWNPKKGEKNEKKDKRNLKKDDKKKSAMKSEESSETESDWESKKGKKDSEKAKRDSKKDVKKHDVKDIESTSAESDESSKKDPRKPGMLKSSDAESEESIYKFGAKKRVDESDDTSTDSKKTLEQKSQFKMSFKKTTFKEKETKGHIGRIPPSRERPALPPCEPLISSKVKRLCRCKMPPPPPKPRYAPLRPALHTNAPAAIIAEPRSQFRWVVCPIYRHTKSSGGWASQLARPGPAKLTSAPVAAGTVLGPSPTQNMHTTVKAQTLQEGIYPPLEYLALVERENFVTGPHRRPST
ncbi:cylicin-1 [Pteropus medius]|uniref:cylicin-1 n=1 Tax=Pteropus vampyrus TaxID=132908 RepID=UPI00196AB184|nr:cylicin-1 [Pteropus giganteus]